MNQTIYVALFEEGTSVWRPVQAEPLGALTFRILGSVPKEEVWEFRPGETVNCKSHLFSDGTKGLVAYARA